MIILIAAFAGAIIGGVTAKRRKGTATDMAQYAVGYAIAFAIVGLFATLFLENFVFS